MATPRPTRQRLLAALALRGKLLAVAASGGLLLPLGVPLQRHLPPGLAWVLDLAVHWQWLWLVLLAFGLALCALARQWHWLALAALGATPWWTASPALESAIAASSPPAGPALTLASANVHLHNADATRLLQWVRELQADVVVVLEVSPAMAAALAAAADYPHRHLLPADDAFGLALLSRHPLGRVNVLRLRAGPPALQAWVDSPVGRISVTALHTMPPIIGPQGLLDRDHDIAQVLRQARATGVPALVAGDFNATPWSSGFRAAEAEGFLRANGLAPTWPAPAAAVFGIPIDDVQADHRHWEVVAAGRGPKVGSDHLPVMATLRLKTLPPTRP